MTMEIFIYGVIVVAIIAGLITQAIKAIRESRGKGCNATLVSGIVAIVVSVLVGAGYMILSDIWFDAKAVVYIIALIIVSWIGSTVGYDKIKEAFSGNLQMTETEDEGEG